VSWGFRKRVKLGPGVSLNIGKLSVGLSGGPRGARVSANSRGRRALSLSWKGLFWRKRL
jgi:hypothetical protein